MLRLIAAAISLAACSPAAAETLTLEEAIGRALADNPGARIAMARVAAAEAVLAQARAAFQPQVRVQTGLVVTNQPVSVFGMALSQRSFGPGLHFNDVPVADNWSAGAAFMLPLYAGGRNAAGRNAARAALDGAQQSADATRQMLAFEVTRAFLLVQKSRALAEAARASAAAFESNLQLSQKRQEAGTTLKTDALDMELRLSQAREELARALNAEALTRQALASLLGLETGSVTAASASPKLAMPVEGSSPQRPEILAAESLARSAEARVRAAEAGRLPEINAFGGVEHNRGGKFDGQGTSFTTGVMVRWELWDGGLTRGRARQAEAEANAASEDVRRQRLAVSLEVSQARLALAESEERLRVSGKSVQLAEASKKLTLDRFESGLALAAHLIDAETALTAARVRRAEAESDRWIAMAALRRALGLPMIEPSSR